MYNSVLNLNLHPVTQIKAFTILKKNHFDRILLTSFGSSIKKSQERFRQANQLGGRIHFHCYNRYCKPTPISDIKDQTSTPLLSTGTM